MKEPAMKLEFAAPLADTLKVKACDNGTILLEIETVMGISPEERQKRSTLRAILLPEQADQLATAFREQAEQARANFLESQNKAMREMLLQTPPIPPATRRPRSKPKNRI
jgi:TfoX/Sxy family transcriptional regulator of competence genes